MCAQTQKVKAATAPRTHFTEETSPLNCDLQAKKSIFQHRNVGVYIFLTFVFEHSRAVCYFFFRFFSLGAFGLMTAA